VLKLFGASLRKTSELASASRRPLLLTLTITCSLGLVASTIYVPSVPAIASALETTVSRVQLTFVGYLAAFAVSMLLLGPLSDRYGRKRTMILALSLSALGSIACAASPGIEFLIGARVLQGIGLSGGMVVGRATIRDLYGHHGAAQIIAGLSRRADPLTGLRSYPRRLFAGLDRLAGEFCRRGDIGRCGLGTGPAIRTGSTCWE
jgi:MFS family permease